MPLSWVGTWIALIEMFLTRHVITNFLRSAIICGHGDVCLFTAHLTAMLSVCNTILLSLSSSPHTISAITMGIIYFHAMDVVLIMSCDGHFPLNHLPLR